MTSLRALVPYLPLVVGVVIVGIALAARKRIPGALVALMITAFIDMIGLLMVIPLLPFYATRLGGTGTVVGFLVSAFSVAQLLSAPMWGRFSDRFGRRPALLVALAASAVAYVIFGFATSLTVLFLSRIVQGAGGGTTGVIQAYVADSTPPDQRAKALGWLSAATNLGVALGPALGAYALATSGRFVERGLVSQSVSHASPGLLAAVLCVVNMAFVWRFLQESREAGPARPAKPGASRRAVLGVVRHPGAPAPRLIWIYAVAIGAFQGTTSILALFLKDKHGVDETSIAWFFTYIGTLSVVARALVLGKAVDTFGEAKLSRIGIVLLATGLASIPLAPPRDWWPLALIVALMPLGTAFTFPSVTALLSRVIPAAERGLYMGVQQTFGGLSRVIFPILFGWSYDHIGRASPFLISAAFVLATVFMGLGIDARGAAKPSAPAAAA
jgi:MFS family permease